MLVKEYLLSFIQIEYFPPFLIINSSFLIPVDNSQIALFLKNFITIKLQINVREW